ncbi:MAG: hypothetical protein D6819_09385 [Gammaproteobacteria bacterium]|nr:MAG: hypothetical protein D6819_09385 [Gammaproteobacteria bacterium]
MGCLPRMSFNLCALKHFQQGGKGRRGCSLKAGSAERLHEQRDRCQPFHAQGLAKNGPKTRL